MNRQTGATLFSLLLHAGLLLAALAFSRLAEPLRPPLPLDFSILPAGQSTEGSAAPQAPGAMRPKPVREAQKPASTAVVKKSPAPRPQTPPTAPAKPQPPAPETIPVAMAPQQPSTAQVAAPAAQPANTNPAPTATAAITAGAAPGGDGQGSGSGAGNRLYAVGQLDGPLTAVARTPPAYPPGAKRQNIEGWIKVAFVVDEQGRVDKIDIVASKPQGVFDQSVRNCVGTWRFKPATVKGMVVKAQVEQTITFKLES